MQGSLKQRSRGSWTIRVDMGVHPDTGRRRQKVTTVRGTKKEAQRRLNEILHELNTSGFSQSSKLTFGQFLTHWLKTYVELNVRARTAEGYESIVRVHLIPSLGQIKLAYLQPSRLQEYYTQALKEGRKNGHPGGLSAQTVLNHHRVIHEALTLALKWGMVNRNVAQAVSPPHPSKRQVQTLDSEGVRACLAAAEGTIYHPIFYLKVYTGLRRSEIMGLRWKDVDLDMATVSVVQALHHLHDGRMIYEKPKSSRGKRLIALTPTSVMMLRDHRRNQEKERELVGVPFTDESLVFCHPDDSPIDPEVVSKAWRRLVRKMKRDGVRLHDLRHTHACLMLKQGVHPKIVSERLGHASVSTTLDIYSHVTPGLQEAAARRFDESMNKQEPVNPEIESDKIKA